MSRLICISGSSGVGKTTFSKLVETVLGSDNVVMLSGDDLHKWERADPMWEKYTHLDPYSNNLDMGYSHILCLKKGESISRSRYNHNTGKFDFPVEILPKSHIIYEGLHSSYSDDVLNISDLSIFIHTDEQLKREWKIQRDTATRGYTTEQVINTINRRKKDEIKYIMPQQNKVDIIVQFCKNIDKSISLEYKNVTGKGEDIMMQVKHLYNSVRVCGDLSI